MVRETAAKGISVVCLWEGVNLDASSSKCFNGLRYACRYTSEVISFEVILEPRTRSFRSSAKHPR